MGLPTKKLNRRRSLDFAKANPAIPSRFIVTRLGPFVPIPFKLLRRDRTSTYRPAALTGAKKPPMGGAPKARADLSPLAERG
jgi:hypothetical protein